MSEKIEEMRRRAFLIKKRSRGHVAPLFCSILLNRHTAVQIPTGLNLRIRGSAFVLRSVAPLDFAVAQGDSLKRLLPIARTSAQNLHRSDPHIFKQVLHHHNSIAENFQPGLRNHPAIRGQ